MSGFTLLFGGGAMLSASVGLIAMVLALATAERNGVLPVVAFSCFASSLLLLMFLIFGEMVSLWRERP